MGNLSPVVRYRRRVEAEVARAHLESAGLECEVLEQEGGLTEVLVPSTDASMATRILGMDRRVGDRSAGRAEGRQSVACPGCRGRNVRGQGRIFWTLLAVLLAATVPAAFFTAYVTLVTISIASVLVLAAVDIICKDWKCLRCGNRWRAK